MPQLGPTELIIVLVLVIIIFGVGKLPEVGGALGKSIKEFRKANDDPEEVRAREEAARASAEEQAREQARKQREMEIQLEVERRLNAERAAREASPSETARKE